MVHADAHEIVPAQPSWRTDFETLKIAILPRRAGRVACASHWVDRRSGGGLQGIIDIQLTVEKLDSAMTATSDRRLSVSVASDHCPPGLQLDRSELKKRFLKPWPTR